MPAGIIHVLPAKNFWEDLIERNPDHYDSGDFSFHSVTPHYVTPDEAQALVLQHRRILCGINTPLIAFIPAASAFALTSVVLFVSSTAPGRQNLAAGAAVFLGAGVSLLGAAACYLRAYLYKQRARVEPAQNTSFDGI